MGTNKIGTYSPSILSQISHELRIPLTGILGMAKFLKDTSLTPQQDEYLQYILASADRLHALAKNLPELLKETQNHVLVA